eukprot:6199660-Pleurochrysis_carterae.AAC.1
MADAAELRHQVCKPPSGHPPDFPLIYLQTYPTTSVSVQVPDNKPSFLQAHSSKLQCLGLRFCQSI